MKRVLSYLGLCLLVSMPHASESNDTGLRGMVTDIHGVAIGTGLKPKVFIHWDASGANVGLKSNVGVSADLSVETDSAGRFLVNLPPGFYDVFVSAFAFSPTCTKIRIKTGELVNFNPKLRVDPLVTKELADRPF